METWQGKHFSITDPKDISTVIYQINKTDKTEGEKLPKYTIERLEFMEELYGELKKKTFFVDNPSDEEDKLIILSFGKERVVVNMALLSEDKISICKKPVPVKFENIYFDEETVYHDFQYTPSLKRPICIIDPETTEEVKPILYFDEETNEVKGKCKLQAFKPYFAFEIRDKNI